MSPEIPRGQYPASRFAGLRSREKITHSGAMPYSAARRSDAACIEGIGDFSQAGRSTFADGFDDRKDASCELISVSDFLLRGEASPRSERILGFSAQVSQLSMRHAKRWPNHPSL